MAHLGKRVRKAAAAGSFALLMALGASASASANTAHYCYSSASPNLGGQAACEATPKYYVTYNQVNADADAVCESVSSSTPAPSPITGVLAAPQDCIGTGASSAGSFYSGGTAYYPWIGNRHSYSVTITSATHFNYNPVS
jgi:hypothetical protein